ncbi:hypothetical protein [Winogradskyella sp. 3972H.M.0a.05]|uniref:hypothetical protein n=1 Tax=Winogradskyella sp. 3972H.M.0a.05 TaxID=2950277 RepID=UPI00339A4F7F
MKPQFKLILILFLLSLSIQAQKEKVYKEVFPVDKNATVVLDLENTTVRIDASTDGKVHFDYSIEFDNYSKKEKQKITDEISISAISKNNTVTLKTSSITKVNSTSYTLSRNYSLEGNLFKLRGLSKDIKKKSKEDVVKSIKNFKARELTLLGNRLKVKDENGKLMNLRKGNVKIMRSQFVIKVPPFVKLNIIGNESQITFGDDFRNELNLNLDGGYVKANALVNPQNTIKVEKASSFDAVGIYGGHFTLNNVSKGHIGSMENVTLASEFSKLEIGEVAKGNSIKDFNSELLLYNFSDDFKHLEILSEYSKINLFSPENNFSLSTYGHNTVHYIEGTKVVIQPSKSGKKSKMLEQKPDESKDVSGEIYIDIVHGIIRYAEDTIKLEN